MIARPPPPPFSAVLLAGGRSTRMGRDKALLPLADGYSLLARQLATLRAVGAAEVLISARAEQNLPLTGVRLVTDLLPDNGPLAGLAAALAAAAHHRVLVLAVDLPEMPPEFLTGLVVEATPTCGVVPLIDGRPEPLAAVYHRGAATIASELLAGGERRAAACARHLAATGLVRWRTVTPEEKDFFANWNTPQNVAVQFPQKVERDVPAR
jgi:molybdopterin-guanine dinucleotide biosynthesis protein A